MGSLFRFFIPICVAFSSVVSVRADGGEPVEGAPVLFARDLVGKELREGERFRLQPMVEVKDFSYVFRVQSDFGDYEVWGVNALQERIREIKAIAHLQEVSQTEAFASSLSQSFTEPVMMTVGVARRPISSVVGLPSGIARYLEGKFYQVRRTSSRAISRFRGSDKEKPEVEEQTRGSDRSLTQRVGSSAGSLSRKHLGYDDSKRGWARELGVDPYSDNERLQEALGRIAWATSIGEFAGDFAVPSTEVVSYAGKVQDVVWTLPPHQLENRNIKALKRIGVPADRIQEFTDCPVFSLTEKTSLVASFEAMAGAEGLEDALDMVLSAETKEDALAITRTIAILDLYTQEVSRIQRLSVRNGMITAVAQNGYMILPLAVDYLHWNAMIAKTLKSEQFDAVRREIWISGSISPIGARRLRELNWHVMGDCFDNCPRRAIGTASK